MEPRGILYFAIGDEYLMRAQKAVARVRDVWPGMACAIWTERSPGPVMLSRMEAWRQSPFERTLALDADVWLAEPVPELFDLLDRFDLAATLAPWREGHPVAVPAAFPEHNCGVVAFRKNGLLLSLVDDWEQRFGRRYEGLEETKSVHNDQPAFREALYHSVLRIATLPAEYNWRGVGYVWGKVKVLHTRRPPQRVAHEINEQLGPRVCMNWQIHHGDNSAMMLEATDLTGEEYHHEVEDVLTLQHLAGLLPADPVVVNIGACFGTSALALLEAREDLFVFSIDIKPCLEERENLARSGVDPARCVRVLGRSQEVGQYWPRAVDMVFMDGSHARSDVVADLEAWLPRIKPGGIVACDDYAKGCTPAVKPVVDEMLMDKYEMVLHVGDIVAFRV